MEVSLVILLIICVIAASQNCDNDEISCGNGRSCIPINFLCDSDDDCGDGSDEDSQLCTALSVGDCDGFLDFKCNDDSRSSCTSIENYCAMNPLCDGHLDKRICVMIHGGQLDSLDNFDLPMTIERDNLNKSEKEAEKFVKLLPNTLRHEKCPPMYTLIGDECISVFHVGTMSWAESREFCKLLSGDLLTFKSASQFAGIVKHLQRHELTSNFWIGGRIENENQGWTWVDDTLMDLGSPFWATKYSRTCVERNVTLADSKDVCFKYYQAPEPKIKGQCVSLSFEHFFFMNDENCLMKMSPLCISM